MQGLAATSHIMDIMSSRPVNQTRSPGQTTLRNWLSDPTSQKPFENALLVIEDFKLIVFLLFRANAKKCKSNSSLIKAAEEISLHGFSVLFFEAWKLGDIFTAPCLFQRQETCSQSDHIFRFITGDGKRRTLCSSNCWCRFQVPAPLYLLTSF